MPPEGSAGHRPSRPSRRAEEDAHDSGLAADLRFVRNGKVRLVVLVSELERVIERLSARWDA